MPPTCCRFESVAEETHVLLVDDECDFRDMTAMLLALEGFRVSEAADGYEAIRLMEADGGATTDVVLLDFRMPGLNGGEVLGELRSRGVRAPAILVSAVADPMAVVRRFGFDGAVPKPCELDQLLAEIRRCVSARPAP